MMDDRELYQLAVKARERSYSPYSRFRVGAALLAMDGGVYMGANIENASYGASNCAERTAFFKAVNEGVQGFEAIAIAGGPEDADVLEFCPPCGICRQVLREFSDPSLPVIVGQYGKGFTVRTLGELLPESLSPEDLGITVE